ncbi:gp16 family protein [Thiocystis violascens]|uniref:Mu-like prophage protein gp16 n=1 Tax=Thiocystis violascens (strain ATCC 17096 / DSM 198 / 6111) TaxID=765911 RepID=I3YEF9_THIV6|nr:regulatory protein GemA [Thiocystis violascens]AFL75377.1 Mu-like prophage protein gp16 [Thiocystis violascens DSM 198]
MDREIVYIHIAKQALGLDDATYRAMLQRIGGVSSSAKLNGAQRAALLAEFRAAGWKPTPPKRAGRGPRADALARKALLRKVQALLADQQLPWSYAEAIVRRQRGLSADTRCPVELIDAEQARGLIAALSRRQRKTRAATPEPTA